MKDYLARFAEGESQTARSFEKALSAEPSKPSEVAFEGFEGIPPGRFSDSRALDKEGFFADSCPQRCAAVESDAGDGRRHTWCATCRWDKWQTDPGHTLREALPDLFNHARAMVKASLERGECPGCEAQLNLQSRGYGVVALCAFCREHFTVSEWLN